jgi:hypothetical protein
VPQLSGGWQHNYSTKTRQAGCANEQSMYSLLSLILPLQNCKLETILISNVYFLNLP